MLRQRMHVHALCCKTFNGCRMPRARCWNARNFGDVASFPRRLPRVTIPPPRFRFRNTFSLHTVAGGRSGTPTRPYSLDTRGSQLDRRWFSSERVQLGGRIVIVAMCGEVAKSGSGKGAPWGTPRGGREKAFCRGCWLYRGYRWCSEALAARRCTRVKRPHGAGPLSANEHRRRAGGLSQRATA